MLKQLRKMIKFLQKESTLSYTEDYNASADNWR